MSMRSAPLCALKNAVFPLGKMRRDARAFSFEMSEPIIILAGLTKSYGNLMAVARSLAPNRSGRNFWVPGREWRG